MYGRALIESRFGPLGCGQQSLELRGTQYDIFSILAQLGIAFDDLNPIDAGAVDGHYVVRYLDVQDNRIVAHEFDDDFHTVSETRAHAAEWFNDTAQFSFYAGH